MSNSSSPVVAEAVGVLALASGVALARLAPKLGWARLGATLAHSGLSLLTQR